MADTKPANAQGGTVNGTVSRLQVSGRGQNSAEIVASVKVGGKNLPFAVYAYPTTEPSVFTSFASMLALAYLKRIAIDLTWVQGPGTTPQIVQIVFP